MWNSSAIGLSPNQPKDTSHVECHYALDNDGFYWGVYDPTYPEEEIESVQSWIVDDFLDIYRDLKTELEKMKLNTDEAIEDVLWQLKFSFRHHWGNHCIDAMRALHYVWYEGKL